MTSRTRTPRAGSPFYFVFRIPSIRCRSMGLGVSGTILLVIFPYLVSLFASSARAQDNYEIQVYGSDLVEPGHTMVELHSNFTFQGSKTIENGMLPTNHQLHETIEITHGFSEWFECGFYIFTAAKSGSGRWD